MDKIFEKGVQQGGFLIPQNKIEQLIKYRHLLTAGQKKQILDLVLTNRGSQLVIRPTRKQIEGGALGAIVASVGIPLAIELASKLFGRGLFPQYLYQQDLLGVVEVSRYLENQEI